MQISDLLKNAKNYAVQAKNYLVDQFLKQNNLIPTHPEPHIVVESPTEITEAYITHNTLTVFSKNSISDEVSDRKCIKENFIFSYQAMHAALHKNLETEKEKNHFHIGKKDKYPQFKTPELKCMLGSPKDDKYPLIPEAELTSFLKQNEKYYRDVTGLDSTEKLVRKFSTAGYALLDIFFKTLMQNYFIPYLLSKGYSAHKIRWATKIIETAFTVSLSASILGVVIGNIIQAILKPALRKVGIDVEMAESLAAGIGTVASVVRNPLSITEIGLAGTFTERGQSLAYKLIHVLPKLRIEPPASAIDTAQVVNREFPKTMRRRG